MEQLKRLLASLSWKQKISILAVAGVVASVLYSFTGWRKERDFKPLYTGLSAEDSAAVVEKLKVGAVEYRVSEGGTVMAPSARVAELRLQMAGAGLPRTGRIGFELFDKTNFGLSEFAEQVNFRRALEGELERSVTELAAVEQARVHLTFPKDSVFVESRLPAKGSVLVRLRPGAHLEPQNVLAVKHMVSSAVEGLSADAVSVMDMQGNLLSRPKPSLNGQAGGGSDAMIEYRQQIERDLLQKIHSTLEPLLGEDRFRAGVSVDCDFSSGEQSEEVYDPTRSVMLASQKTEDSGPSASSAGVPGTASNLPAPPPRSASTSGFSRKTENVTYQSSRTIRRTTLPQGSVKRVSVSLLLDHDVSWSGEGAAAKRALTAPSPEKVKAVRELVAGLIGLNTERGDQIVVEALPFDSTLRTATPEPASSPPPTAPTFNLPLQMPQQRLIMIGAVAGGLILLLGVSVAVLMRKRRRKKAGKVELTPALEAAAGGKALVDAERHIQEQIEDHQAQSDLAQTDILSRLKLPVPQTKKSEVLRGHLRGVVEKDAVVPAQVLRRWINEM